MPVNQAIKSRIVDEKDKKILLELQKDGRTSLTKMAKQLNISVDSVKNRMEALRQKNIYHPSIFINPRALGFSIIADIKIKLGNITTEERNRFIKHLSSNPHCTELLSVLGDYDFTCVIIAKNTDELDKIQNKIREEFKKGIKQIKKDNY